MDKHAWLVEVVKDLAEYARLSDLRALAPQLDRLREIVVEEVGTTSSKAGLPDLGEPPAAPFGAR